MDPSKVDPVGIEPSIVEPVGMDPSKVDPVGMDPSKVDPVGMDPSNVDPVGMDPSKVDPVGIDPSKVDPVGMDPSNVDPVGIDPSKVDPVGIDPSRVTLPKSKVDPVGMDLSNVEPDVSVSTNMVATVGAAVPAAIVDPPWAAICSLSELISSLAALYLSVAAALRFVCSATALSAVDLADWPCSSMPATASASHGVARGVTMEFRATTRGPTEAGSFVNLSIRSTSS